MCFSDNVKFLENFSGKLTKTEPVASDTLDNNLTTVVLFFASLMLYRSDEIESHQIHSYQVTP